MRRPTPLAAMTSLAVLPMARRRGLASRIATVLDGSVSRQPVRRVPAVLAVALAVAAVGLLAGVRVTAGEPAAPTSAPADADAAALVRQVRAAEAWVDTVGSFHVTLSDEWAGGLGTTEIGFDRHRLYRRTQMPGWGGLKQWAWDGRQATAEERHDPPHAVATVTGTPVVADHLYARLGDTPEDVAQFFWGDLAWGRAGPRAFWWMSASDRADWVRLDGSPDEFHLDGRTTFRGVPCTAVSRDRDRTTILYIGVADGRLYGIETRALPDWAAAAVEPIARAVAAELGRPADATGTVQSWLDALPPDRRQRAADLCLRRARHLTRPSTVNWMADYREVAPGKWFPMTQGYDLWDERGPENAGPSTRRTERVTLVEVDRPLPEAWFALDWQEGVWVNDRDHEPPLFYRFQKQFTPAEWQAILDEAKGRGKR